MARTLREPVPVQPFLEWFDRHVRLHGDQEAPVAAALATIGWDDDAGQRRLNRWRHEMTMVDRDQVEDALHLAGVQFWEVYGDDKPAGRVDRGRSYNVPEDVLIEAHRRHLDGESLRAIARDLHPRTYCATVKSLAGCLSATFRARGWETRPPGEATALSNIARAVRPFCSHIHQIGPRRGERCARRCVGNDQWCYRHNPVRMAEGIARARQQTHDRVAA